MLKKYYLIFFLLFLIFLPQYAEVRVVCDILLPAYLQHLLAFTSGELKLQKISKKIVPFLT